MSRRTQEHEALVVAERDIMGWTTTTCKTCRGRGRQRFEKTVNKVQHHTTRTCRTCKGTGRMWVNPRGHVTNEGAPREAP